MPEINNFKIDTSNLPASKTARQFTVGGEKGAEFTLQVANAAGAFYNWKTKQFNTGYISENNFKKTLTGDRHNGNIVFPAATTTTYNVILIAPPDSDTTIAEGVGAGKNVINKSISQVNNTVVTFAATTAAANAENYGDPTTPASKEDPPAVSITSTGDPYGPGSTIVNNTWTVHNRDHDSYGWGLRLTRQPVEKDWYFGTTEAIVANPAGDGVSNNTVTVADLSDLAVGTELIYHKGTTAPSSTTHISSIDTNNKTLTFSTSQAFEDGETMTFRAYGFTNIKNAIGLDITSNSITATPAQHYITVRDNDTDSTIPIVDTYGISGGVELMLKGEGINTSSANYVTVVNQADTDGTGNGEITMTLASTVTPGSVLYVVPDADGVPTSTTQIGIEFTFTINTYPSSNRTISLNLDNFITPGISGA